MLGSSLMVGSMTMLSRVMGLLRDVVLARFFGAGEHADAFFVAFRIPQFLRRLFAEGAFAQAFVPVLSEYRKTRESAGDLQAVRDLINARFPAVVSHIHISSLANACARPTQRKAISKSPAIAASSSTVATVQ